jgi:hypothetical protein
MVFLLSSLSSARGGIGAELNQDGLWPEFAELWPDPSDHGDGKQNSTKLLFA